ncbi:DNA-binding transcriptional regulator MetR [Klebsiella pneumoniae]|uniref:DNA-binding transcriptional regulator MetR n=1 Tax=Klebsiella pneumoniae TaxID=573 RepID=A0A377WD18_KLEPN|nr:DNA-binding transcriptional regulator MetR [Klebsiella pneumoniae]
MIEIKHLKTLQALRNSGSLAGAAAALHQTQSALSHQFSDLEQRLGFRLFVRKSQPAAFYASGGNPLTAGQPGAAADRSRPAGL